MPPAGVALTWLSIRQNLRVRSGREWRVKKIHARQWKEVKGKKVLFYKIEWDGAWKDWCTLLNWSKIILKIL